MQRLRVKSAMTDTTVIFTAVILTKIRIPLQTKSLKWTFTILAHAQYSTPYCEA
ncbi:MAG: hypothetical protein LBK58_02885 [Prevotellaceae bacterium]|nr:hypothetical protein [Prevotellaceae bacterium]